ncbi:ribosomal large subunit pseudouridine synthase D [Rubritalea halochordaticola]|uniref:Pseudouridine synthase n=1 Tax=Rubritalea halochordaticola TaxID=714537 RepID=A0ABP9V0K9_9BACT
MLASDSHLRKIPIRPPLLQGWLIKAQGKTALGDITSSHLRAGPSDFDTMKIHVDDTTGTRLDVFLTSKLPELSRAKIQALLKSGDILVNNTKAKPKNPVNAGDEVTINIPEPETEELLPEDIPLDVLYEDEHIIVINKEHGLVVHPAAGNASGTLVNALLHHCQGQLAVTEDNERPGIVHRLDKDTSGCIVVAKSNLALKSLLKQFADRDTKKHYLAAVQGRPKLSEDTIFTNIGRHPVNRMKMAVVNPGSGKPAITSYKVLGTHEENDTSLMLCDIHTGRTHQIRVHMVHIGTPILGDPIYSKISRQKSQPGRLMLHARRLVLNHPATGESMEFLAPIPDEFHPWTEPFYSPESHEA